MKALIELWIQIENDGPITK